MVKHLTSLSAMFTFVDVSGDAALEAAFEEAAGEGGGGGAPLLFVCGGSDVPPTALTTLLSPTRVMCERRVTGLERRMAVS